MIKNIFFIFSFLLVGCGSKINEIHFDPAKKDSPSPSIKVEEPEVILLEGKVGALEQSEKKKSFSLTPILNFIIPTAYADEYDYSKCHSDPPPVDEYAVLNKLSSNGKEVLCFGKVFVDEKGERRYRFPAVFADELLSSDFAYYVEIISIGGNDDNINRHGLKILVDKKRPINKQRINGLTTAQLHLAQEELQAALLSGEKPSSVTKQMKTKYSQSNIELLLQASETNLKGEALIETLNQKGFRSIFEQSHKTKEIKEFFSNIPEDKNILSKEELEKVMEEASISKANYDVFGCGVDPTQLMCNNLEEFNQNCSCCQTVNKQEGTYQVINSGDRQVKVCVPIPTDYQFVPNDKINLSDSVSIVSSCDSVRRDVYNNINCIKDKSNLSYKSVSCEESSEINLCDLTYVPHSGKIISLSSGKEYTKQDINDYLARLVIDHSLPISPSLSSAGGGGFCGCANLDHIPDA